MSNSIEITLFEPCIGYSPGLIPGPAPLPFILEGDVFVPSGIVRNPPKLDLKDRFSDFYEFSGVWCCKEFGMQTENGLQYVLVKVFIPGAVRCAVPLSDPPCSKSFQVIQGAKNPTIELPESKLPLPISTKDIPTEVDPLYSFTPVDLGFGFLYSPKNNQVNSIITRGEIPGSIDYFLHANENSKYSEDLFSDIESTVKIFPFLDSTVKSNLKVIEEFNPIGRNTSSLFLNSIRNALEDTRIKEYTKDYFSSLAKNNSVLLKTPKYKEGITSTENLKTYIKKHRIPLSVNNYYNPIQKRKVQLYGTINSDVNLRLQIGQFKFPVTNDNKLTISTLSGNLVLSTTPGDILPILNFLGQTIYIPLESDKGFSYSFDSLDRSKIANYIRNENDEPMLQFSVSTPTTSGIEYDYNLSSEIDSYFFLTLDINSLEDIPYLGNSFRKTRAKYTLVSSLDLQNDLVKFSPSPTYILTVNYNDTFLSHLKEAKELTGTFLDINISTRDGAVYPRKIPKHVVVIPTNKNEWDPFKGESTLESIDSSATVRTISPIVHPDYSKINFPFYFIRGTYPGNSVQGQDYNGIRYGLSLTGEQIRNEFLLSGVPPSIRDASFFRLLYRNILRIDNSYITENDDGEKEVLTFDIYSILGIRGYSKVRRNINSKIFNQLNRGEFTNIKLRPVLRSDINKTKIRTNNLRVGESEIPKYIDTAAPEEFKKLKTNKQIKFSI